MPKPFIATPNKTKDILKKHQFAFKKSLGQNFLVDVNVLGRIIEHAGIDLHSGVIEIGPGIGSLTEQLAIHSDQVIAYEIDQRLLPILEDTLQAYENTKVIHADILQADVHAAIRDNFTENQPIHVVANLPYYITTPILMKLLQDKLPVSSLTVMIQKEVADRMAAQPNSKSYGSLSVAVQYYTEAEVAMHVPKQAFIPPPNVTSSVLKLTMREKPPVSVRDEEQFFSVVRACFVHRRKTLLNNLANYSKALSKQQLTILLNRIGISQTRRGESLSIAEFAELANALYET
ncbi:16S rRNA (adenine(1518)-N(6)/adenine(1519)-N(6))-dimethyltransferase RsmA [Virgibacillus sp. W0181]|uniref:16S rRNA (adenine(1518)-N(6)/adenine(1519)-N(6))- dimethyltransferase RsmA n=1 Tax=Virgibacillus sp. W0181 TaxID=3391581 RepID=UPI003F47C717